MIALDYLLWVYLEWVLPRDEIEPAPKFPYKKFKKVWLSYTDKQWFFSEGRKSRANICGSSHS